MAKYRRKPVEVEALRLGWDTWSEMCEFAGVGRLTEGKPQGCWVEPATGEPVWDPDDPREPARTPLRDDGNIPSITTEHEIGMLIPTKEGVMLARQGDFVVREPFPTGDRDVYPVKAEVFEQSYEPVQ